MYTLVYAEEVESDLKAIFNYIAEDKALYLAYYSPPLILYRYYIIVLIYCQC